MDRPEDMRIERRDEQVRLPRLLALCPVVVEARWDLREQTERFYGRWLGLGEPGLHMESTGTVLLIFHNDGPDVMVRLTNQPYIQANKARIILEVPDLGAVRHQLDAEGVVYQPIQAWYGIDRRLGLWDPSGNRLEVKRLCRAW
jgi:extradiol dioxygenase family protein